MTLLCLFYSAVPIAFGVINGLKTKNAQSQNRQLEIVQGCASVITDVLIYLLGILVSYKLQLFPTRKLGSLSTFGIGTMLVYL